MRKITLYVRMDNKLEEVVNVAIPPFMQMPDVIMWGMRFFKLEGEHYIECMVVVALSEWIDIEEPAPEVKSSIKGNDVHLMGVPESLEDAIEDLKVWYGDKLIEVVSSMNEDSFRASSYHSAGLFIRDSWFLWWQKGHHNAIWPETKPKLIQFFNDMGIYHANDISSIILTSVYREISGKEIDLQGQVQQYKDYWESQGFKDGIFGKK